MSVTAEVRWLLRLCRQHSDAVEADLFRYYGIDYGDRFRRKDDGRPRLTLRRIFVLVRHLPPESSVGTVLRGGEPHWTVEAHLVDDVRISVMSLRQAFTRDKNQQPPKPHPLRPGVNKPPAVKAAEAAARTRNLAKAKARAAERARRIATGELT